MVGIQYIIYIKMRMLVLVPLRTHIPAKETALMAKPCSIPEGQGSAVRGLGIKMQEQSGLEASGMTMKKNEKVQKTIKEKRKAISRLNIRRRIILVKILASFLFFFL